MKKTTVISSSHICGLFALLLTICSSVRSSEAKQSRFDDIYKHYKTADSNYVLVVAHRAEWRSAPENSVSAIKNAIAMGIDVVELDVRKTKDGHLVLMHDSAIHRTTNGKGHVKSLTLEEIKSFRLKFGRKVTDEQVPTLKEAMLAAKGKIMVNIDPKGTPFTDQLAVLKETGTLDHAIFKTGAELPKMKLLLKGIPEEVNFMPICSNGNVETVTTLMKESPVKPSAFEFITKNGNNPLLSRDVVQACRKNGARVWINTLWASLCAGRTDAKSLKDPDNNWGWFIDRGFNMIQTDRPKQLLAYLRKRGLHD